VIGHAIHLLTGENLMRHLFVIKVFHFFGLINH